MTVISPWGLITISLLSTPQILTVPLIADRSLIRVVVVLTTVWASLAGTSLFGVLTR